ncbi:hypothetical protein H4I95_05689 [Botrytis cinerea]
MKSSLDPKRTLVFPIREVMYDWSDDDDEATPQKPKKHTDTNFGFFEAKTRAPYSRGEIQREIEDAKRKNPSGVMVAGVRSETMNTVAGYLHFQSTGVLINWLEDKDKLGGLLDDWLVGKRNAFHCPVREGSTAASKDFGAAQLFKVLIGQSPEQIALVTGNKFPITHDMLGLKENRDEPGYFCYLHAIHRVITTYPDHFPNDTPFHPREIHSRENWHRGLITLRSFWLYHKDGKIRQRSARSKPAFMPLWINQETMDVSGGDDEVASYAVYKQREANEILDLEDQSSDDDDYDEDAFEGRQDRNIAEIEDLHRSLNTTGDVNKEASARGRGEKKQARKSTPPEQMKDWIQILKDHHKKHTTVSKPVKGPSKSDPNENSLIVDAISTQDTLDSIGELSAAERDQFEKGKLDQEKKDFFQLLESMSSATAMAKSFVECCENYGFDYSDPKNIKVRGVPFKPYPHQVIDMAWLADMENSPMEGGLLAAECGSGKTAIILLLILITHYRLVDENSQNHFATLIVAPSSVIDVWYADYVKFFGKALNCRIFYGQASNSDPEREKCFVGNNIKDFENELKLMSPNDPNTSRTFFLTSYTTFSRRAMKIVSKTPSVKGKEPEEVNYVSDDENEIDCMQDQDEGILRKYELMMKHTGILGRLVTDESHSVKNPCTLGGDALYKLGIRRHVAMSATAMINRINDLRGLLIQILGVKELPLRLPTTLEGLQSMYDKNFNPFTDLPMEGGKIPGKPILMERNGNPEIDRVHDAIERGFPIHILCPQAFLVVGNKSLWKPATARVVLRPILELIQRKRLLSTPFETIPGVFETPGEQIPHYTVKTVNLKMTKKEKIRYDDDTSDWRKKLFVPSEKGAMMTSVKKGNSESDSTINMEAYRGLQLATFDRQLVTLIKRKVKNVPVGTSQEVRSWYERDDDHGISFKFYKSRPKGAEYIPPFSNRLQMAQVTLAKSEKLRALIVQVDEWKSKGERCMVFVNWPISQWACEQVLTLLEYKVMSLLSSHTSEDRRRIIAQFNDPNHKVDVLLIGIKLGSYGLNFHGCCCKMIIMEYPSSIDILLHVFGRLHRLGQKKEQEIIIFFLEDSFDGKLRSFIGSKFNSKLSAEADLGHITDDKLLEEADKLLRRLLGED